MTTTLLPPPKGFPSDARAYRFADEHPHSVPRVEWTDGPWDTEPDKVVWVDPATDFDAMIVRNRHGALCGYVGVPEGHPWFGRDYTDIDVEVHGGLTFADRCEPGRVEAEHAICHTPRPGHPEVFWFGFDCGHAFDYMPGFAAEARILQDLAGWAGGPDRSPVVAYRDLTYVLSEVESLAAQAKESARV